MRVSGQHNFELVYGSESIADNVVTSNSDTGEYFDKRRGFSQPPAVFGALYCVFAQPVPS